MLFLQDSGRIRTTWLVAVWTGSLPLAVWAAATEVLIYPRTYGYPKVLLYSVATILMLAYARAPTRARRWGLAAITVIAFLFRHDHGLFIGLGSALVVCVTDRAQSWRIAAGRLGELAFAAALIAAPYAVYVSTSVGIANHVRSTLEFSVEQAQHNPPGLPHLDLNALSMVDGVASAFFYAFWIVPLLAVVLLVRRQGDDAWTRYVAVGVTVLAISVNASFLRNPLPVRVSDAIVPFVLLVAWIVAPVMRRARRSGVVALLAMFVVTGLATLSASAGVVGDFAAQIERAGVLRGRSVRTRTSTLLAELRAPYAERLMSSRLARALVPFYEYVQACTTPDARLFVPGFAPEVSYFAGRGFAGGQVALSDRYYVSIREQRRTVARLQRELVPFVILPPGQQANLESNFPFIWQWVRLRYVPLTRFHTDLGAPVDVLVREGLSARRTYGNDRWPCFL